MPFSMVLTADGGLQSLVVRDARQDGPICLTANVKGECGPKLNDEQDETVDYDELIKSREG